MIKVNLAPPTTKRPRRAAASGPELNLGLLFGGILAALVLIIGGWWLAMSLEQRRLSAEIDNNKRELARLQPIIAAGQRYRRERDELEKRLNAIETVARNQARPVYLLDAMADTLPPDLWLTRLEERGPSLRIAGTTYSSVALSDFMANLKASGRFKDVDLVDAKQDLSKSPRTITFEVTCRFEI
jgi:type IV pilus assembly protein PilN